MALALARGSVREKVGDPDKGGGHAGGPVRIQVQFGDIKEQMIEVWLNIVLGNRDRRSAGGGVRLQQERAPQGGTAKQESEGASAWGMDRNNTPNFLAAQSKIDKKERN